MIGLLINEIMCNVMLMLHNCNKIINENIVYVSDMKI